MEGKASRDQVQGHGKGRDRAKLQVELEGKVKNGREVRKEVST